MKWMKELWIYTIKNLTLVATIFFSSLNIINVKKLPYKFNIFVRVKMTHLKRLKYFVRIE